MLSHLSARLAVALLGAPLAIWPAWRVVGAFLPPEAPPRRERLAVLLFLGFAWAASMAPPAAIFAASLGLAWLLACLACIDVAVFRLPDVLTLPLAATGLGATFLLPGAPILDHVAGALLGWVVIAGLAAIWRRTRGVEGIGLGDAKLLAGAGAWLGWAALPSVVLIACAAAFLWVGVRLIGRGRSVLSERIAFGAPLCLATWIVWLHGPLAI